MSISIAKSSFWSSITFSAISLIAAFIVAVSISTMAYAGGSTLQKNATPTFSPAPGNFTVATKVTISCATQNVPIRYTTDGTLPTATSNLYSGPIDITKSTKLTAIAFKNWDALDNSDPASGYYVINSQQQQVAKPVITPAPGTFTAPVQVTIACDTKNAIIRYTTDATTPTPNSPIYNGPFTITKSTKVKAIAYLAGSLDSDPEAGYYVINAQQVAKPTLSPTPGTFTAPVQVTISCATPNAVIRYTTNATTPTANSPVYNGPFTVSASTKVEARAFLVGSLDSDPVAGYYVISAQQQQKVAVPVLSPTPGTFTSATQVTISCSTPNASIRYTTDGTLPTVSSTLYTGAIAVSKSTKIIAKGFLDKWTPSDPATGYFVINITQKVATPVFTLAPGTYVGKQKVGITCETAGAVIRFTTNGTAPTANSPIYTAPIVVEKNTPIAAKAFKPGMTDSDTLTGYFVINSAPITQGVDLMILTSSIAKPTGEGIVDLQGTQTASKTTASRRIASYVIAIKNTGNAIDYYVVKGVGSKTGWYVNYMDASGKNVTQLVSGGYGWVVPQVLPGKTVYFRLDVTPVSGVANDDSIDVVITATSKIDTTKADQVKATTTKVR